MWLGHFLEVERVIPTQVSPPLRGRAMCPFHIISCTKRHNSLYNQTCFFSIGELVAPIEGQLNRNGGTAIVVFIGSPITHVSGVHPVQNWSAQAPIAVGSHAGRPSALKTHILASAFSRVVRPTHFVNVRNILGAENFKQLDLLASDLVLDPQVRHIQVTDLAKTFAPFNTYCSRSIAVYSNRHCPAHIAHL